MVIPRAGEPRDVMGASRLFVLHGDLARLDADAYLIPSDVSFAVGGTWRGAFGDAFPSSFAADDESGRRVRYGREGGRLFLLADIGTSTSLSPDRALEHIRSGVGAALDAAGRQLAAQGDECRRERPLVAMPLVGTRYGGFEGRKGLLVAHLVGLLEATVPSLPFDVALVCFDRPSYAAVQSARKPPPLPEGLASAVTRVAGHARSRGLAVLFGAGVSMPLGLPSWGELLELLGGHAKLTNLTDIDPLDAASLLVDGMPEPGQLATALQAALGTTRHSLSHGLIASLRPPVAITTNYDGGYEIAMRGVLGARDVVVMPWEKPALPSDPRLVKLHGDVQRGSVVLSRQQFVEMHALRRPLTALLQEHMLVGHVLAVGTTLSDPTMAQAAEEVVVLLRATDPERLRQGHVGTWVQTTDHPARRALWQRMFDVQSGDEGWPVGAPVGVEQTVTGARTVDAFLDAVAHAASDELSFVADPAFADLVADHAGWTVIAEQARSLRQALDALDESDPRWTRLREALDDVGAVGTVRPAGRGARRRPDRAGPGG